MFDRTFGVELEVGINLQNTVPENPPQDDCTCDSMRFGDYCPYCEWDDAYFNQRGGYGVDCDQVYHELSRRGLDNIMEGVIHDGTDVEITTRPLRGETGLNGLRTLMNAIKDMGGYTTSSDGTHIHIDAPDYARNDSLIERLGKTWLANNEHIYKTVDPERVDWHYCPQFSVNELHTFLDKDTDAGWYGSERCDLNFEALDSHGTIEIRLHEGTLDFDELRAWIVFMGTMVDTVATRSRYIKEVKSLNHLFTSLKLDRKTRSQLRKKAGISAVAA